MYAEFENAYNSDLFSFQSYLDFLSPQQTAELSSHLTVALDVTLFCAGDYGKFNAFLARGLGYANHQYIAQCLIEHDALEQFELYTRKHPDLFIQPLEFFHCMHLGPNCLQHILNTMTNDRETYVKMIGLLKIHSYDSIRMIASHPRFKHHPHLPTDDIKSSYKPCIVLDSIIYHLNLFKVPL
jgi:hypothetical protein